MHVKQKYFTFYFIFFRTRKSLTEKIRELGVNLKSGTPLMSTQKLQHIDLKVADTRMTRISLMIPNLNLEQLIYYQPELIQGESSSSKNVYKITKFETKSTGPKEVRRISDIEVKSFKPTKKMKFRRKKRRSSIISRVEEILNRGKGIALKRDESEETIVMNYYEHEKLPKKINDLPESILQNIFFWVPQKERALVLSRVCKWVRLILKIFLLKSNHQK